MYVQNVQAAITRYSIAYPGNAWIPRVSSMENISLFLKALHFAADKHRDQRRKDVDASPYINHPIYVAQILAEIGGIEDIGVLCAAVLHDTVEDTQAEFVDIQREFGERIAGIVAEVTDDKSRPKAERKRLQIEHARHMSDEGALVKLADKIANVRDVASNPPGNWDQARRREYLDWAEQVVRNCPKVSQSLEGYFAESLVFAGKALDCD
jgi:GTP diphosphokinase / guanosine-3',5'-bis(diphosphate) 3'-diphosphatase